MIINYAGPAYHARSFREADPVFLFNKFIMQSPWGEGDFGIILFGFKGSGKTTFGKQLAAYLKRSFIDTDDLILTENQELGKTIYEICKKVGEERFRELEQKAVLGLSYMKDVVIATGGGTVCNPKNLAHLQELGKFIYLKCPFETILPRILSTHLPSYVRNEEELKKIYEERCKIYETIPALVIDHGL